MFIPPVYEVYRGYIVRGYTKYIGGILFLLFPFVCLCVCKLFFPSKISQELLDLGS